MAKFSPKNGTLVKAGKKFPISTGRTGQNIVAEIDGTNHELLMTSVNDKVDQFLFPEGAQFGRVRIEKDGQYVNVTKVTQATVADIWG